MHYCFLTTGSWEGNASLVRLREFGTQMVARGVRVSYVVDDVPYNRDVAGNLKLDPRSEVRFTKHPRSVKQLRSRRRVLKELRPDVVHVLNPFIKAYAALATLRSQRVVGDWDEWPAHRPYPPLRKAMERYLDHWLRARSRPAVVASKYRQRQFKERHGLDAVYIPYATYLQEYPENLPSPFDRPTAVYMGNLYPAYDHDLLFEAARILKSRGREAARLVLMGSGPDVERWRDFVRQHQLEKMVAVPGFVGGQELWRQLRHAHVLLFPIRQTLLNLCRCPSKTYAYAQARRPIIANRVGEVAEVLQDKAQYIEPAPEAFADAIDRALSTPTLPDVDYGIERHNWTARTDALLAAVGE